MNCETACSRDACPKKIIRFRHSDFIERTKRSANAFKFGDRGGRRIRRMPSRSSALRNSSEYFVSRSSIKYRHSRRKPASVSVRLRAIWPHPSTVWVRRDAGDVNSCSGVPSQEDANARARRRVPPTMVRCQRIAEDNCGHGSAGKTGFLQRLADFGGCS